MAISAMPHIRLLHVARSLGGTAAFLLLLLPQIVSGQDGPSRPDPEAGRYYVQARCTGCHSVEPQTDGVGTFAPDFTAIARHRSARWITVVLHSRHPRMPEFVLKPSETVDIVAYILSLKK